MKYRGYIINAFLFIFVIPLIVTIVGVKIINWDIGEDSKIEIMFHSSDRRENNNQFRLTSPDYWYKPSNREEIIMELYNSNSELAKFKIDISCTSEQTNCNQISQLISPSKDSVEVKAGKRIMLPVAINVRDDIPPGKYSFNISVTDNVGQVSESKAITVTLLQ